LETKLEIWRQGQFYPQLGKKIVELPYDVNPGPSDDQVSIKDFNVSPDRNGNFLKGNYSENDLNAIQTFGIVRMVIDLFEDLLAKPIIWSWNRQGKSNPLTIEIRRNGIDARFLKEYRLIELDHYGHPNNHIYNCRTVDLIAHETGHAIIDSFKPDWEQGEVKTKGLAEAFCDLTAMFWILSQRDLCEEVIRETNGDLAKNSILSLFGVGHGYRENTYKEIRDANKSNSVKENQNPYDYSENLVNALYKALIDLFVDVQKKHPTLEDALYHSGQSWMKMIMRTFLECNDQSTSIYEFSTLFRNQYPELIEI